jgi:hypothetical protein
MPHFFSLLDMSRETLLPRAEGEDGNPLYIHPFSEPSFGFP